VETRLGSLELAVTTLDYTNPPQASGQITVGPTWNFQFRYPATGASGVNLSDGLEITFCP
jgi:hypothetical protein